MTTNEFRQYIQQAHDNACSKGYWNGELTKTKCLMLIITEVAEAVEADRKNRRFDYQGYLAALGEMGFEICFKNRFKGTIEEELADICIRIFDFCGGFVMKDSSILKACREEIEAWQKMPMVPITSFPDFMFSICRKLTDVFHVPFPSEHLGTALGRVFVIAQQMDIDLHKCIEIKLKYNKERSKPVDKAY